MMRVGSGWRDQPEGGSPEPRASWTTSYIVPVYNGEAYLAEALDSILAQTLPALEVLVVDDGSSDGTPAVARRYGDRITYLRQPHAGQSVARNHGVRVARGNLLAFLDADDLAHPAKLARQVARFEARPELDLCQALTQDFWSPEMPAEQRRTARGLPRPHPGNIDTWLVRRTVFERIGGLDPEMKFGETVEWYWRARESGASMELLPEVVAYRRVHGNNMTRGNREEQIDSLFAVLRTAMERKRRRP